MLGLKQIAEIRANLQCLPNQHVQQEQKPPEIFRVSVVLWQAMFGAIIALPMISHFPRACKGQ